MAYQYVSEIDGSVLNRYNQDFPYKVTKKKKAHRKLIKQREAARVRFLATFFIVFAILIPNIFISNCKTCFLKPFRNSSIKVPKSISYFYSAENAIGDDYFLDTKFISRANTNNPVISTPGLTGKMPNLERKLKNLMASYPALDPGIFIWDYSTGKFVDINADKLYPTASIIKLPILLQLFKRSEKGLVDIKDSMSTEKYFLTGGSGFLQYFPVGTTMTLSRLAELMIQQSDNTASNMLLSLVGGMNGLNRVMKNWGFNTTHFYNWLPDLKGTNVSTPKEIGKMLYNIDNPDFLSLESRAKITEIMGHVKNSYLIQAGLPRRTQFLHKTGDIGNMLGDAGTVILPDGRKYIIVLMVKRPWNSYSAKQFIIEASEATYTSISRKRY